MYWYEFTYKKNRGPAAHAECCAKLDPFCRSLDPVLPVGWSWADWEVGPKNARITFEIRHVPTQEETDRVDTLLRSSRII